MGAAEAYESGVLSPPSAEQEAADQAEAAGVYESNEPGPYTRDASTFVALAELQAQELAQGGGDPSTRMTEVLAVLEDIDQARKVCNVRLAQVRSDLIKVAEHTWQRVLRDKGASDA